LRAPGFHAYINGAASFHATFRADGFRYEWDEAKRVENLAKHGIDFLALARFDWETHVMFADLRRGYGEPRFLAYGPIDGRLHALVFTRRGETRRIISLRKANRREQAAFEAGYRGR
jgi:uncharacterized protein